MRLIYNPDVYGRQNWLLNFTHNLQFFLDIHFSSNIVVRMVREDN